MNLKSEEVNQCEKFSFEPDFKRNFAENLFTCESVEIDEIANAK